MQWNSYSLKCDLSIQKLFGPALYMLLFCMKDYWLDSPAGVSYISFNCSRPGSKIQRNKQCDYGRYKHLFFHDFVQQIVGWRERHWSIMMGIREGMRGGKDSFSKEKNWKIVICYGRFHYIALLKSFTYTPLKKCKNKHGCKMLLCSSIML